MYKKSKPKKIKKKLSTKKTKRSTLMPLLRIEQRISS